MGSIAMIHHLYCTDFEPFLPFLMHASRASICLPSFDIELMSDIQVRFLLFSASAKSFTVNGVLLDFDCIFTPRLFE